VSGEFGKLLAFGLAHVEDVGRPEANDNALILSADVLLGLLALLAPNADHRGQNADAALSLLDLAAKLVPRIQANMILPVTMSTTMFCARSCAMSLRTLASKMSFLAIEIDNNTAERALRVVALGRKNYLFCGSNAGGERAAAIYSLLGSAKLNSLDPELYLQQVLERIADSPISTIAELLPWNIAVAKK
jgi:hypothetical protein